MPLPTPLLVVSLLLLLSIILVDSAPAVIAATSASSSPSSLSSSSLSSLSLERSESLSDPCRNCSNNGGGSSSKHDVGIYVNCHAVFDVRVMVSAADDGGHRRSHTAEGRRRQRSLTPSRRDSAKSSSPPSTTISSSTTITFSASSLSSSSRRWRVTLDEILDDGALLRLAVGRALPLRPPAASFIFEDYVRNEYEGEDDRRGDPYRILIARVVVPYSSFASASASASAAANFTRDAVVMASLVREEYHSSDDGNEDEEEDDEEDDEIDVRLSSDADVDVDDDDRRRRGRRRRRREVIVDRWLFNVELPVAGRNKGDVLEGNNGGGIARAVYRDPIYVGTLEDGVPPQPNMMTKEKVEVEDDDDEEEALVDLSNKKIDHSDLHPSWVAKEDGRRIVQACLYGLFGGIAVVLAIVSMSSSSSVANAGDDDDDDNGNNFMTPSPARVVGVDDLPRYTFEEHGMKGRRLFLDCGDSSSSSSSPSRDAHHLIHDETTDDSIHMTFNGHSAMDEQIESRSELPRDYADGETSSSPSDRDSIDVPRDPVRIESAESEVTASVVVHVKPCENKDYASSKDYIAPSSYEEKYELLSSFNNDTGARMTTNAENPTVTICDLIDPDYFSPSYSQGPDLPLVYAGKDDIACLPYCNTFSMSEETNKSFNGYEQSNVDETHFGREEKSSGNMLMPKMNKSCEENQFFVINTSTRVSTGTAIGDDKDTAPPPDTGVEPGRWQQIGSSIEIDKAELTNCNADGANLNGGSNSLSFEEKLESENIDVADEESELDIDAGVSQASGTYHKRKFRSDVGNEAAEGRETKVNNSEDCMSDLQSGMAIGSPTSPPKIGRMVLKETSPSFPRFVPVAIIAPGICRTFSENMLDVGQEQKVQQPSPIDTSNPSVSSSAMTASVNNVSNAKRSHPSATEFEGRDENITSQLSTSISRGHNSGTNERQQSTKVIDARVSTGPISSEQSSLHKVDANGYNEFNESARAYHDKNLHFSPMHLFGQHLDHNEVEASFGLCGNDPSDDDSSFRMCMPLSTRSLDNRKALFTRQGGFSSPTSTVAATVETFTAPRRKIQVTNDGSDRPFPISSGDAGQSKRLGMSSNHVSSSNDGSDYSTCKRNSYQSENRDDLPGKKSRSKKKKRKIEMKLYATSMTPAVYKPSSALIPLSYRFEEPAWQISYDHRSQQSN